MKKILFILLILLISTICNATTDFNVSVKDADGDYATWNEVEDGLDENITVADVKVFSHGGITGTISDGASVTGVTSGATGVVIHATSTQILIKSISGTFQAEQVQVDGSNHVTTSDTGDDPAIVVTFYNDFTVGNIWDGGIYDSENTLTLQGDTAGTLEDAWDGTPSGGVLVTASGYGAFKIQDPSVTVQNLVLNCDNATCATSNGVTTTFVNIILNGGGMKPTYNLSNQSIIVCVNCVSIDSPEDCFDSHYSNSSIQLYNCSCINPIGKGYESSAGYGYTNYAYNSLCVGAGGDCFDTNKFDTSHADYNACSDETCAAYTNNATNIDINNEIVSGSDPHLASGSSLTIVGTNTSSLTNVLIDIDNDNRTGYWSIGADEYNPPNPADETPPVISNPSPSGELAYGTTATTMSFNTNEVAVCKYDTTADTEYIDMSNFMATTSSTTHSQDLSGLEGYTDYEYYVRCLDVNDNYNIVDYSLTFSVGALNNNQITAYWASDGGDKMPQEDLWEASEGIDTTNYVWNGETIDLWGAKNEVVHFNVFLEAQTTTTGSITLEFDDLVDGSDNHIRTTIAATNNEVFDYVNRNIENYYTKYLEVRGMSAAAFRDCYYGAVGEERRCPPKFMAITEAEAATCDDTEPCTASDFDKSGVWTNRPDANKHYPDILIPMEIEESFTIAKGHSQQLWTDIYIPDDAPAGNYTGTYVLSIAGTTEEVSIPVNLEVKNITLPDESDLISFTYLEWSDMNGRLIGKSFPDWNDGGDTDTLSLGITAWRNTIKLLHRHKYSTIDSGVDIIDKIEEEQAFSYPVWNPALDGSLFTSAYGYDGPGVNTPNRIYSLGTYGRVPTDMGMYLTFKHQIASADGTFDDGTAVTSGSPRAIPKDGTAYGKVIHQGAGDGYDANGYKYEGEADTIIIQRTGGEYFYAGDTVTDGITTVTIKSSVYDAFNSNLRPISADNIVTLVNTYETFFQSNFPDTERFMYYIDEPSNYTWLECEESAPTIYEGETITCAPSGYNAGVNNFINISHTMGVDDYPLVTSKDDDEANFDCGSGTISFVDSSNNYLRRDTNPMSAVLLTGSITASDVCSNNNGDSFVITDLEHNNIRAYESSGAPRAQAGDVCTSTSGTCTVVRADSAYGMYSDWATWAGTADGNMQSFMTITAKQRDDYATDLDLAVNPNANSDGNAYTLWQSDISNNEDRFSYNSRQPYSGSWALEDVGIAPVIQGWGLFKHRMKHYFFWAAAHWQNSSYSTLETNVFDQACTFGRYTTTPEECSTTNRSGCCTTAQCGNGDGVLIYPATDHEYPAESYGLLGVFPNQRLKMMRRGFQDYDLLTLAYDENPEATDAVVASLIPLYAWEYRYDGPGYHYGDESWSNDPEDWNDARLDLVDIILGGYEGPPRVSIKNCSFKNIDFGN